MITASNTSRILRNPSLGCEGFRLPRLQIASIDGRFGESLTNPSRSHTHARALRVRTREGVCET